MTVFVGPKRALLGSVKPAFPGSPGYDEATAYLARMSPAPNTGVSNAIRRFFYDLFVANIWPTLDAAQIMPGGAFANAALNIKGNTKNFSATGTVNADPWGLRSDGSTGYLTGWGAPNSMTKYTQNDAHVSFFVAKVGNGQYHWGSAGSTQNFFADCGPATVATRLNSGSGDTFTIDNALGLTTIVRRNSTTVDLFRDGVLKTTWTRTSSALSAVAQTLLMRNSLYSTDTMAFAFIGSALTADQVQALYQACIRLAAVFGWVPPPVEQTQVSAQSFITIPEVTGSTPGKGFTNTGLCSDDEDDTWWLGNDGRGEPSDTTHDCSIVHLSADFSTVIANFPMADYEAEFGFSTSSHSVQGVAVDTSDSTIFAVCKDTAGSNTVILHIGKDGTYINHLAVPSTYNGLAYDAQNDRLLASGSTGFIAINKATAATIGSSQRVSGIDQITFISANRIAISCDPSRIEIFNRATDYGSLWLREKVISVPEAGSIEGLALIGGNLLIANDAYFHQTGRLLNEVLTFDGSGI